MTHSKFFTALKIRKLVSRHLAFEIVTNASLGLCHDGIVLDVARARQPAVSGGWAAIVAARQASLHSEAPKGVAPLVLVAAGAGGVVHRGPTTMQVLGKWVAAGGGLLGTLEL